MPRMTRQEYRDWLKSRPDERRYELVDGEPVAMAPERVGHARLKVRLWAQLQAEIQRQGLPCEALPDGITVEIDDATDYEPDVLVNCGERLSDDAIAAPHPLVIVEVLSPGTRAVDTGRKLMDYFRLPGMRHYLVVRVDRPAIVHHRRQEDGTILTTLHQGGRIDLDPPGLTLDVDALYTA
ncbi:MAG: hypothetical protein RLY86_1317 [Pseudomonadota bacterium]